MELWKAGHPMSALSKEKIDPGILGERAHSIYFSLLLLLYRHPYTRPVVQLDNFDDKLAHQVEGS